MFLADGGGGSATAAGPTFTGTQRLHIEPAAIPDAITAFTEALDRVSAKIRELSHLKITEWAGDPVSGETAEQFAERTNSGGADSAMACLTGYQTQLQRAITSLEQARDLYLRVEGDNYALWGTNHQA